MKYHLFALSCECTKITYLIFVCIEGTVVVVIIWTTTI